MRYGDEWHCDCNDCTGIDPYAGLNQWEEDDEADEYEESLWEQEDQWSVAEAAAQEAYDRAVYEGGEW